MAALASKPGVKLGIQNDAYSYRPQYSRGKQNVSPGVVRVQWSDYLILPTLTWEFFIFNVEFLPWLHKFN